MSAFTVRLDHHPGESARVCEAVAASRGPKDLGLHHLKGVSQPGQIFQLQAGSLLAAFPCGRMATRRC